MNKISTVIELNVKVVSPELWKHENTLKWRKFQGKFVNKSVVKVVVTAAASWSDVYSVTRQYIGTNNFISTNTALLPTNEADRN